MKTLFWRSLVVLFIILAIIGAILPGMPTTVFLILAGWAASKGWPEVDAWLLQHPKYGNTLKQWRQHKIVPRKAKYWAISMMAISATLMLYTTAPLWVKIFTNTIMLIVGIWLWTRPEMKQADILIDLKTQTLILPKHQKKFLISSGLNGVGEQENSGKTPRGWHCIEQKIGHDLPLNTVFIARQPTGEIYSTDYAANYPTRDWILTRILWLKGLEQGFNLGNGCDTYNRYIYIHGTPETEPMGQPKSHGCIRMHNQDLIQLFDLVPEQSIVYIAENLAKTAKMN